MLDHGADGVVVSPTEDRKRVMYIVLESIKGIDLLDLMNEFRQRDPTRENWPGEQLGKILAP